MTLHPPKRHPKNPITRFHGWDEIVPKGAIYILVFFIFFGPFFLHLYFFSLAHYFFSSTSYFYFYFGPPLTPYYSLATSYLPLKITYYLSSHQPIYLPPFALPPIFLYASFLLLLCAFSHSHPSVMFEK